MADDLSLYIHIPFCKRKCLYCDFPSWGGHESHFEKYVKSLKCELEALGKEHMGRNIDTIFIGGGTPTVLSERLLGDICESVFNNFSVNKNAEFTCEANPGTVDGRKLNEMNKMGINRLSFGVQAWQNGILESLGRIHNHEAVVKNIYEAREAGFKNINCDIMFSLPKQTMEDWLETLEKITSFNIEHISAYSLIVEDGTPFKKMYDEGKLSLPDEETDRQMYHIANEFLGEKGFMRYEISNFAKKGYESRHNITYWDTREYIGAGLGSHSYIDGKRFHNTYDMDKYIAYGGLSENIKEDIEVLSEDVKMEEFMFMGLRMARGIEKEEFKRRFNVTIESVYKNEIEELKGQMLLEEKNGFLFLTDQGIDISNYVFEKFIKI